MSAEQRKACREWLVALPSWNQIVVRGAGLTASDTVKNVVLPELERARGRAAGGPESALVDMPDLVECLGEIEEPVIRHVRLAWAATDDGLDVVRENALELTPVQIGGAVLRAIAKAISEDRPVTAGYLEAIVAARITKAPPAGRRLSREAFASAYAQLFDERWEAVGKANLAKYPHDIAGLGPDEKPPLVRYESENHLIGTARSVFSRFKLATRDHQVGGDADTVARAEVERACGRWGLLLEGNFVVMRSLHSGMVFAPVDREHIHPGAGEFSTVWQSKPGPLRESVAEHPLAPTGRWVHGELAAFAQAQLASFLRRQESGRYLRHSNSVDEGRTDAMKRAWMLCFEDDRRNREPDADRGTYIVHTAVTKGIIAGRRHRWDRLILAERIIPESDDPAVFVERRRASYEYGAAIGTHRARLLVERDPVELALYEDAARDGAMLPLDELILLAGRADQVPPETEEGGGDAR